MGKTTTQWAEDMLDGIGDELDTIRTNLRALVEALAAKDAENAELLAALANERGEGEAPCEGWQWEDRAGRWWLGDVVVARPLPPAVGWRWGPRWATDWQSAGTARSAMRAASISPGADSGRP